MAEHSAEKDVSRRGEIAAQLRHAAERCCQCTDGHHDWFPAYPYGTDGDVRMIRDLAREIADLLDPPGLPACEAWTCQSCGADNFIPAGFERVLSPGGSDS